MKIDFPLMSILSVAFLAFFLVQGGDVELHSIEVGFSANVEGTTVTIDPAFFVWADHLYPADWLGETFGNVAVVRRNLRDTQAGAWIKRFELNHILQYHALGWWSYLAGFFLSIDPSPNIIHWDDPNEADRVEWLPLDGWSDIWHWLTLSVDSQ